MQKKNKLQVYAETLFWGMLCFVLLVSAYGWARDYPNYDDTDDVANKIRSEMALRTDHGTGCQYLVVRGLFSTSITPRLNRDGYPLCK